MKNFNRLGNGLNAFNFQFEDEILDEVRSSYRESIEKLITDKNNQHMFEGGTVFNQALKQSSNNYFLTSYGKNPLLWFSCNNQKTYDIYKRFFDALDIEQKVKELVDHDEKIIMYCGFLVIGDQAEDFMWHVDYFPDANAYTLITPLFELDDDHNHLLYKNDDKTISSYNYSMNEAIIFGDHFLHSTEPYGKAKRKRILLSITFGTDKIQHWDVLKRTIGSQSDFLMLPCGHRFGTCECIEAEPSNKKKVGRNSPCHCGSGKKYKHCHGK